MTTVGKILRFADFELDRDAYELRRNGRGVPLERIPLDLLFLLIERPGRLVTRQEIIEGVWKGVFVDAESAICTAIRKLRRALNDDPDTPRFVATIPAKGYRFVGIVASAYHESKVPVRPAVLVGQLAERLDDARRLLDQLIETLETDDDSENVRSPYDGQPFYCRHRGCAFGEYTLCDRTANSKRRKSPRAARRCST